jgi:hypothetical protein
VAVVRRCKESNMMILAENNNFLAWRLACGKYYTGNAGGFHAVQKGAFFSGAVKKGKTILFGYDHDTAKRYVVARTFCSGKRPTNIRRRLSALPGEGTEKGLCI